MVEAILPTLVSVAADNSVEDLRVRQASVAEAVAGFMRGMSSSKAPGTGATGAGKRVTFTAEHAQPGHGEDPLWAKLLGVTATIVDTLSVAWCGDWAAAVRWVVCRRQPGAVAPLLRPLPVLRVQVLVLARARAVLGRVLMAAAVVVPAAVACPWTYVCAPRTSNCGS